MIRSLTQACSKGRGGTTVKGRADWVDGAGEGRLGGATGFGAGTGLACPFFIGDDGVNARIN